MRNLYRAQVPVTIDGHRLTVQFDYDALAAIRAEIGDDNAVVTLLRGIDPKAFAGLVAIGLRRNHPDWTAERVYKAAPPIRPTVQALEEALNALYFGAEGPPEPDTANPLKRIVRALTPRAIRPRGATQSGARSA